MFFQVFLSCFLVLGVDLEKEVAAAAADRRTCRSRGGGVPGFSGVLGPTFLRPNFQFSWVVVCCSLNQDEAKGREGWW